MLGTWWVHCDWHISLTCWAMPDGEPWRCKKKTQQHTHSSTKLLTRVTVADKLVLVNSFWWNNHLFIVQCAVYSLFQVDLYSARHWLFTSTSVTSPTDITQYCTVRSWYMRKRIDHWCSVVPEKSKPSGPPFSGKLGKPRFPLERWAPGLGFFCLHWTPMMDSIYLTYPVLTCGIDKNLTSTCWNTSDVIGMLKWRYYVCVLISFWEYKNAKLCARKRIHYLCEDGIENSVPRDHYLPSLSKPCDAKLWSSRQIFSQCSVSRINLIKIKVPERWIKRWWG